MTDANGKRRFARQGGVALITALLIVALAAATAAALAARQQLDIRRTGNVFAADQAYLHALGVEDWAVGLLAHDARAGKIDHLGEDWAKALAPSDVERGRVAGDIEDLQGRFNINNLVDNGQVKKPDVEQFQRLLRALTLDPRLAQAVVDWLDADIDPQFPDGAEDDIYLKAEPPHRTANGPMALADELRLVQGFTPEIFKRLGPYVTALPSRTIVNVNTASLPVLMSLVDGMDDADAQALLDARATKPFESVDEFVKHPALAGRSVVPEQIGIASSHFAVHADVEIERSRGRLTSLLARTEAGKVRVFLRSRAL